MYNVYIDDGDDSREEPTIAIDLMTVAEAEIAAEAHYGNALRWAPENGWFGFVKRGEYGDEGANYLIVDESHPYPCSHCPYTK